MIRIAKPTNPQKIAELKKQINSSQYLDKAIAGIADTLAHGLLQWNGMELDNGPRKR